jgi:outer membrane translocation and assembly module TamA
MMTKKRETFSLEFKCTIVILFNIKNNHSVKAFLDTLDYRALGQQKGFLKDSTVRGWLNNKNKQMSIASPQFKERLDEARESKREQGRYHYFETRLTRKFQDGKDYQNGYTIKQIQCVGACTAESINGYKIVQETRLSFGCTRARWFIRRFGIPSQTCKDRTVNK